MTGPEGPESPEVAGARGHAEPRVDIAHPDALGLRVELAEGQVVERPRRRRDPARKDRILAAAAELVGRQGFHTVGMADIGAAAGIVGSGVYRHFPSKSALLAALLTQVMDELEQTAAAIVTEAPTDRDAVESLVENHIRIAIEQRRVLQVYHREAHNLPEEDLRRLRRAQRHYVEEWVVVLAPLRRDLSDAEVRLTVHAAIGTTQAVLFHHSGLPAERTAELLGRMGRDCLGVGTREEPARSALSELPMT